jgi:two-component system OmpR family response regulator
VAALLIHHEPAEGEVIAAALEAAGIPTSRSTQIDEQAVALAGQLDVIAIGSSGPIGERVGLCRRLRAAGYLGAVVAASDDAADTTALLDAGADDFITAPARAEELVARVQIAIRRAVGRERYRWGPIELDRVHRTVALDARPLLLTAREYGVLVRLLEAGGQVVSRAELLASVWGRDADPGSNLVEVHTSRLRTKLGKDAPMIETVRGAGYRLRR